MCAAAHRPDRQLHRSECCAAARSCWQSRQATAQMAEVCLLPQATVVQGLPEDCGLFTHGPCLVRCAHSTPCTAGAICSSWGLHEAGLQRLHCKWVVQHLLMPSLFGPPITTPKGRKPMGRSVLVNTAHLLKWSCVPTPTAQTAPSASAGGTCSSLGSPGSASRKIRNRSWPA